MTIELKKTEISKTEVLLLKLKKKDKRIDVDET